LIFGAISQTWGPCSEPSISGRDFLRLIHRHQYSRARHESIITLINAAAEILRKSTQKRRFYGTINIRGYGAMNISLKNPKTRKFVDDQVKSGRFGSAEQVLDEAVHRMMDETGLELDAAALDAIDEAEDQIARGQVHDWKKVSRQLRAKYLGK
jgi:Arc/MetJ-type ribon-helix-helix transcriptional regulator